MNKYSLLLLLVTVTLLSGFKPGIEASTCDQHLEKFYSYHRAHFTQDKVYVKFRSFSIEQGSAGEPTITQVWMNGATWRFENEHMVMLQDKTVNVTILKSSKQIIIRHAEASAGGANNLQGMKEELELLRNMVRQMTCEDAQGQVEIKMTFPQQYEGKSIPFRAVNLTIDAKDGALKKGTYVHNTKQGSRQDVYEYLTISNDVEKDKVPKNATDEVYNGKQLKSNFQSYLLKDLR